MRENHGTMYDAPPTKNNNNNPTHFAFIDISELRVIVAKTCKILEFKNLMDMDTDMHF